jgi:hypothetical protein
MPWNCDYCQMYILLSSTVFPLRLAVRTSFPLKFSHFGGVGSFTTANSSSCVVFITPGDHSNLSSEMWERVDGKSNLGGGWETYGEGTRRTVPDDAIVVPRMERNEAEVDGRRFGGERVETLDLCAKRGGSICTTLGVIFLQGKGQGTRLRGTA